MHSTTVSAIRLEIVATEAGETGDELGWVEFIAHFKERGEIKRLMVVEEMPKPSVGHSTGFGFQRPVVSCGATYTPKRVWGFVNVKPDGSAHFRVPAERAIYFLPLDEQGRAVQRMRTFTHLMPGEVQGCVGCHASRNSATPHLFDSLGLAMEPPQALTPPDWGVRGFDYMSIVQPVWDKHCVACHDYGQKAGEKLNLAGDLGLAFNTSYDELRGKKYVHVVGAGPYQTQMPMSWGSHASRLTRILRIWPRSPRI